MKKNIDLPTLIDKVATKNGVTDAGIRLLEVVTRPECRAMTVLKQCELAQISSPTYYALFNKDARFKAAYLELCQSMLLSGAASASQALIEQASKGDPACIKMVLELAGLYQNTATINVNQDNKPTLKDIIKGRKK